MPANVNMPFEEFESMRQQLSQMGEEIRTLRQKLTDAKLDGGDPVSTRAMASTVRASLSIVSFAVANLSPEIIKRWPYQELRTIADNLKSLPDYIPTSDDEYGAELSKFAVECEVWETRRKQMGEQYVPPPAAPNAPSLQELMQQTPNPIKQREDVKLEEMQATLEAAISETQS